MNDDPSPPISDNIAAHRFETVVDGHRAVAMYQLGAGTITFTHTLVPEALKGRGIGTQLVKAGLAAAQQRHLGVIPQCPLFAAYMRRHAETHVLLAPEGRALLGV